MGIIFYKHLTFKNHLDMIARKISKSIGISFKLYKYLSLAIMKTLYYTLINPFYYMELKFGVAHMPILLIKYSTYKNSCRAIHNLPYNTFTNEFFKNTYILKVQDLYESQMLIFCTNTLIFIITMLGIIVILYPPNLTWKNQKCLWIRPKFGTSFLQLIVRHETHMWNFAHTVFQ